MPLPQMCYAQVVKAVRWRCLADVQYRIVFGTIRAVQQVLAACGWQINTALVEQLNLDLRQRVAAVGRRVTTLCLAEDGLRQPLLVPEPTNGHGAAQQGQPCTPARAAGLTDRG